MLAALRRVLLESRRLELMSPDDYTRATDIADIKAVTLSRGRALSASESVLTVAPVRYVQQSRSSLRLRAARRPEHGEFAHFVASALQLAAAEQ